MAGSKSTDRVGGISSAAVERATGKSWEQWLATLDADGAAAMTHAEIASHLSGTRGVGPWWSQMVTVGYEQARGRRRKHQVADGFSVSGSRTVPVPLARLYRCWADARRRGRWLDSSLVVSTATENKSIRARMPDGTRIDVNFYAKGAAKSMVQVQHSKLTSARAAAAAKAAWKRRLDALVKILASAPRAR